MKQKWVWMVGYGISGVIFGVGLLLWNQAAAYIPVVPEPAPLNHYVFSNPESKQSLSRYTRLLNGELFFEKAPESVKVNMFHSNLKIYGIIRGKNPRAVVGLIGADQQTNVIKPGAVVGGEKVVTIGVNYIVVRNESGQGKVGLE